MTERFVKSSLLLIFVLWASSFYLSIAQDSLAEDSYVITSGPGAGTVIHTLADIASVTPDRNPSTQASGVISPPDMNCNAMHYHGTIFGQGDPDPEGCGWGKDFLLPDDAGGEGDLVSHVTDSIELELEIIDFVKLPFFGEPPFEEIASKINNAIAKLDELISKVKGFIEEGKISTRAGNKIIRKIKQAKRLDEKAKGAPRGVGIIGTNLSKMGEVLNKAVKCKRKIVTILANENLLIIPTEE